MLRRIELVSGVAAGAVGIAGLLGFVFLETGVEVWGEVGTGSGSMRSGRRMTRVITEEPDVALRVLVVGVPILLCVALGAWWHARSQSTIGGLMLIVGVLFLWAGTMAGAFSVGFFVLPAALLATISLLACGLGRDVVAPKPPRPRKA